MRRRARNLIVAVALLVLVVFGGRWLMLASASGTAGAADLRALKPGQHRVAVVFGAGLAPGGGVSPLLDDRLRAAEDLLHRGVVDRLLMTGDNSVPSHNEPGAMRRASMRRGVPADVIAVDYGGRRTWDSCVRAHRIFGVRNAVLVSSDFHRARTIVECRAAGLHVDGAVGASTDRAGAALWIDVIRDG